MASSPLAPVFTSARIACRSTAVPGHDPAAVKTYRYLRLGMLVAVAILVYSVLEEYFQPGVHCLLGSFSGYYYTPVRGVFTCVMVAIGFALIVIKGRTALEDVLLSLAGMMAPVVAFIPTSDDLHGVCRPEMLRIGHYQPDPGSRLIPSSISNNVHALVFAGFAALVIVGLAILVQWRRDPGSVSEYTTGTWVNLGIATALVLTALVLVKWSYSWVLQGHARAACAMFVFLAAAAGTNSVVGFRDRTGSVYAWTYGMVGLAMIVAGLLFVLYQRHHQSALGGHLVLTIETVEIALFVVFWGLQTVERWTETV
jgi:hypothetical protein